MIKKQTLVVFVFLCTSYLGFGQIAITGLGAGNTYTQDFNTLANTGTSTTVPLGWSFSESGTNANTTYTSGTGSSNVGDTYSFGSTSNSERSFGGLQSGSLIPTIGVNFTNNTGSIITELIISYTGEQWRLGATARVDRLDFQYSLNATSLTTGTWVDEDNLDFTAPINTGTVGFLDGNLAANRTSKTFTITGLSIANGAVFWLRWNDLNATGADDGLGVDDFSIYALGATATVDFCNVDFPENGTIVDGGNFIVYAQAYELGVTEAAGQGAGLNAWIGYSTTDATTTTDFTSPNWTWVAATFNSQQGSYDQFEANIGPSLSSGTYYYVSRFQLNAGPYTYGGKTPGVTNGGNFWDGTSFISGILTVTPDQVNFCNVQYPKSFGITTGSYFEVYAQVYEPGVTDSPGEGTQIDAWIGYNTISINHQPWDTTGWTWIPATYNPSCFDCNSGANDEYYAEIGCGLPAGTYYYASRFQLNGSDYSYGGIQSDGVGNFWDATNNSGTLTITDPPLADVVITEIMYNTTGTDDEWIEICNISGSTQNLSNYIIEVGGATKFTFPCGTTIANGTCITIDLGDGGGTEYNFDCPFVANFSSGLGTGTLVNSTNTITIKATNGTTADIVTYNSSDGANGNGSSLHVIDATQDNSDTGTNWQEVAYGGSSGLNSLVPNCLPAVVEINVEGNLGAFPDIPDDNTNSNTPIGTNNTLFAAQLIGASQAKTYRIQNLGGLNLTISSISINGVNPGDFTVTLNPVSPIVYGTPSILEITFSPLASGERNAIVTINNNDSDENPYTFNVRGTGLCVASSNTITPSSGPEGTIVTVTGTNLSTATASFNGIAAVSINHISSTLMEITVPSGETTGNLEILDSIGCTTLIPFTVIDNKISSCEGGSALTEIFISEITDATYGGLTYIELYNPTNSNIDLSNYSIDIYINGNTNPLDTGKYKTQALSGTILAGQTFVISTGYSGSFNCDGEPGGDASYSDFNSTTLGGINKETNKHDFIGLYKTGALIDAFGVFGDSDWMDTLHTAVSGDRGFDFRRLNTATPLPQSTFDDNDWTIIDWVGSGSGSCSTNDYSDIGIYDFSSGTPPLVNSGPTLVSSCNTATISVSGSEGYSGSKSLTYQWYVSAPGTSGWTALTNNSTYSNVTMATLNILDTSLLEGYQYYCQIREDDSNCYSASDAVQLTLPKTTWNGTAWSPIAPDLNTIIIIDGDYDTAISGSFNACNLIINAGKTLNVRDNTFVKIQNNVVVDGALIVQTKGAFVQVDDFGTFTLNSGGQSKVIKVTSDKIKWYEYTYWSSPVIGETVENVFPDTPASRRFWFNSQNYKDSLRKKFGRTINGQDDIDDDGNDWQIASGTMTAGLGYAATASPFVPNGTFTDQATFEGAFNTGNISVPIYRNDDELNDNNWNFLGNPYPSAISADLLLVNNLAIDQQVPYKPAKAGFTEGAIFLWSQNSDPSTTNNGNQNKNFSQNDYAIISMTSEIAGGDGIKPNRFIPSGQGFFIAYDDSAPGTVVSGNIKQGSVTFTNSMRMADGTSNSQFFRTNGGSSNKSKNVQNKLWVNLTSDNGVFNQLALGYVDGATNGYDGMGYDTPRNLSNPLYSSIYTMIDGDDKKFAIQGKNPSSLTIEEVIPIGFDTSIDVATLYTMSIPQIEGEFLSSNPIYVVDHLMQKVHNLSESGYTFTSEIGEFKDRFELVFQSEALSDSDFKLNSNLLTIIELNDGRIQIKSKSNHDIKSVQIIDLLGRTLYRLMGSSPSEIYDLSSLSQSAYIAKVELSNGQTITKRAVKRR